MSGVVKRLKESDLLTDFRVDEGETMELVGAFVDGDGVAVEKSDIISASLVVYDVASLTVIRNESSVLDSIQSDGYFRINFEVSDVSIVGTVDSDRYQRHRARLTWQWNDGIATRKGIEEFEYEVRKLPSPT